MRLTEDQLTLWGRRIGEEIATPVFIGLSGPLGSGKSVFARAVARGAGVTANLPSPTFNVLFRYPVPGAGAVTHADLYRLESEEDLFDIGWAEVLSDDGIILVEWPGRAGSQLPEDRWEVEIRIVPGEPEVRVVDVRRIGSPSHLPGFPVTLA